MSKQRYSVKFVNLLLQSPRVSLALFILILALLIPGMMNIKADYSTRIWFNKSHPQTQNLDKFEKIFGNDQTISISLHDKNGVFNKETLELVKKITDEFYEIPSVIRVESLANYNFIESKFDEIVIAPFLGSEGDELEPASLKEKALNDEVLPDYYISRDATVAIIYGYLAPSFEKQNDSTASVTKAREIIEQFNGRNGVELFLLGEVTAAEAFREVALEDNISIVPFMMLLIMLLLLYLFRSFFAVVLPLALIGATILSTLGMLGWGGFVYNSMLSAIPGILFAICLADAIHILVAYYHFVHLGNNNLEAIKLSLVKNFIPTLLTSITTAVGFLSISLTEILPIRDLGFLAAFGTMLAWIFTYLLFSSVYVLFNGFLEKTTDRIRKRKKTNKLEWEKVFSRFVIKNKIIIIVSFILLTGISGVISLQNEVNADPIKYFDKRVTIRSAYDFITSKINGVRGADIVIDSGKDDGIKDPDFLNNVDAFLKELKTDPEITQIKSLLEIIKKLNEILHDGKKEFYKIPETQKAVAELLFFYQLGLPPGTDLNNQISLDNSQVRVKALWNISTSKESEEKLKEINKLGAKYNLKIWIGGNLPIYTKMNSVIVSSFFYSFISALSFVMFLIFVVFRDLKLSVLSLLPNIIPLIIGGAALYLLGYYVDIGTSMVIVVCLGIAVDDTIHFISNFKKIREEGKPFAEAIEETFEVTGKALVLTTFLLVCGFGSFAFANFVPNQNFGILCSIILLFALLTDLLFLPAILSFIDKKE